MTGGTRFDKEGFPESLIVVNNRDVETVNVSTVDETNPILAVPLLIARASISLAIDTVLNSRTVTLNTGHNTQLNEIIELADPDALKFMQSEVLVVDGDVITLDQPVNRVYPAATAIAQRSSRSLLVDGSVTPQVFSVLPLPSQSGHMTRVLLVIEGPGNMDFSTFGSDAKLFNGCVIRIKEADGNFKNLFNFKTNGDFIHQGLDHDFLLPRQGNTTKGFVARVTWGGRAKHGVVIPLDGSLGEELQVIVQDDLRPGEGLNTNTKFILLTEGHEM